MRHLRVGLVCLSALGMGFLPQQERPAQRWALIVGVGDYQNYSDASDLPGARNDARGIYQVLTERWGFDEKNIRLLLDSAATRAAIQEGLTTWLPSVVRPSDLVVFYYAGHGGQSWDQDGDETDGLDETICPTDALRGSTARDIKDDEIGAWLGALPTSNVTVIFDSCHSGTATRALTPHARTRAIERNLAEIPREEAVGVATRGAPRAAAGKAGLDYLGDAVFEIAAAQPDQSSMETLFEAPHGGLPRPGGVFTTNFLKYLWQVPVGTSYEEVFRLTRASVKEGGFAQNPQLSTGVTRSTPLFALGRGAKLALASSDAAPSTPMVTQLPTGSAPRPSQALAATAGARPVSVVAIQGRDTLQIGGGTSAGITVGSVYRIGNAAYRVARVSLQRAFAAAIATRGIDGVSGAPPAVGSPVELVAYAYPEIGLRVSVADLPAATRSAIATAIASLRSISLETDPEAVTDLLLRRQGGGLVVLSRDGFVRRNIPGGEIGEVAAHLRQELGARRLSSLENPAHPFAVDFTFSDDGTRFRVGDRAHFRIRSARDGHLTIVDVDAAGKVNVLFPRAEIGTANRIRAGQEILIPDASAGGTFEMAPPVGRGIVRAFVTERPLSIPFQEADAPQAELIAKALREAVGAGATSSTSVPVSNWSTASIAYEILP